MTIRVMTQSDIERVSQLCRDAFDVSIAPTVSAQGCDNFYQYSAPETLTVLLNHFQHTTLVYERKQRILGMVALKQGMHVSLLFVDPTAQRQGIGRALIEAMLPYCCATSVTVRASLTSVAAYQAYGFVCTGVAGIESELTYQPMERLISTK